MSEGPTVVIVEDDSDIRTQIAAYLESEGFRVAGVDGGASLDRHLAAGVAADLIVLDWMLPGEDALSICRRLRQSGGPPIIMLTAKDEDIDRVLGLEMGADDYVSKPFNPRVLLARIRAVLRRAGGTGAPTARAPCERLAIAGCFAPSGDPEGGGRSGAAGPAAAMPPVPDAVSFGNDDAQIIQVYGGCGPYRHRGPYGGCRPGGQWGGYIRGRSCPPGFHIGPYGRRCWRN